MTSWRQQQLLVNYATTLSIIWQPPLNPNGDIKEYSIVVDNRKNDRDKYPVYDFTIDAIRGQQFYSLLVANLGKHSICIDHYICIPSVHCTLQYLVCRIM